MWMENVLESDLKNVCNAEFIPWDSFRNKTFFITGSTGLIGNTLVRVLLYANRERNLNLHIVSLVRNEGRARERFGPFAGELTFVVGTMEELPEIDIPLDYIVHGANQTASNAFLQQPVETIVTAVKGTENVLKLAYQKNVLGMVYLSSMEVYGVPEKRHKLTENETGAFSPLKVRNSYPISKMLCENLCCGYASEYGIPVKILRLTQTFGPGVNYDDGRIFAEFGRCVLEKKDIVLKTKGETKRSYLYTADAATAILTVLLNGEIGQAYNAADESTYCSIAEMAEKVASMGEIQVKYELQDVYSQGYLGTFCMDLDTSQLKTIGWFCPLFCREGDLGKDNLETMFQRMFSTWKGNY